MGANGLAKGSFWTPVRRLARRSAWGPACAVALALAAGGCAQNLAGPTAVDQPPPQPVEGATVALLVPLTGAAANVGRALQNGAQLAVFETGEGIKLRPYDTQGTPEGARAAAQQAVTDGARLILGPLFAGGATAVRPVAQQANINVITFSNNRQVAGGGVYVLGLGPGDQIDRVVSYAISRGKPRIGAMLPRNGYGNVVAASLREAADRYRGEIVDIAYYTPQQSSYDDIVQSMAAKADQMDALVLPEGGATVAAIAPAAARGGLDPARMKYLGTALWNNPQTGTIPQLAGAWFAAPDPGAHAAFAARYQQAFGTQPHPLATLGYEGVALASDLARNGFLTSALTSPSGFTGLNGIFRFNDQGVPQRGLAVYEVPAGSGMPVVIDPAPASFDALAF